MIRGTAFRLRLFKRKGIYMETINAYPRASKDLLEKAGCVSDNFRFFYSPNGIEAGLIAKGSSIVKLSDPLDMWKLKEDGITIKKTVSIAYPNFLFGPDGIACKDAEIGICIIWTNHRLTQTGHILPQNDISNASGRTCFFEHTFLPGEIDGDLELSLRLFIKKSASVIEENEEILMNEEGVSIGEIDSIVVDFDSIYMEFPIEEYSSDKEPLWWIEFSQWEDPKIIEKFTKDNICLYLNPFYSACPMTDGNIKNIDMLIEILSTAYLMMFQRLSEEDLSATRNNIGLEANSICSILHQFIEECNATDLRFESAEMLLKSLQVNIRAKLMEGDS